MYVYRSSVIDTDQLQIVADKLFWVLYIDCVSLSPSVSLDACFLATTAALQNGTYICIVHCYAYTLTLKFYHGFVILKSA